ncbi:MAG: regulatory protein TetR [Frankiales bacterium]|nr:regulatory protein TetR [Frankiales bacterium]
MGTVELVGDAVNARRGYTAPQRKAQALATRRAVLDAARKLFVERGYVATTVADIARAANVAVDTVYAAVGPKPSLLRELVETALSGQDDAVVAEDRDYVRRVRAAEGAADKLATYALALVEVNARVGPVHLVLREAARTDAACDALRSEITERRAKNMLRLAGELRATGELRADLDDRQVADILWSTNSAEFWALLTHERGWTLEDVGTWLADAWVRLLLA